MSNSYVIQWRSKVNGRAGKGTKTFSREAADDLVEELNQEYPEIEHLVVGAPQETVSEAAGDRTSPALVEDPGNAEETEVEEEEPPADEDRALSA
jgi:hypothetical protein